MKPRKIHKTKKLQSKRKAASFNTFEEKDEFVKITSNARAWVTSTGNGKAKVS